MYDATDPWLRAWLFAQLVQRRMKATYARYSAVPNRAGIKGAGVASAHPGRQRSPEEVHLEVAPGTLTDMRPAGTHAITPLAGECTRRQRGRHGRLCSRGFAHALQGAADYAPLELRTAMFPVVEAGARFGITRCVDPGLPSRAGP